MDGNESVCEVCGHGGNVVGAIVFDSWGNQVYITVHIVCEQSRLGRMIKRREQARWN